MTERSEWCLMEYVSVLAGEPPTDRPVCTHPWPAALGRWTHDRVAPPSRARLRSLAPELIGLDGPDEAVRTVVARCCARLGAELCPGSTLFSGLLAGRRGPRRLVDLGTLFLDVWRAAGVLEPGARDEVMVELLADVIAELRSDPAPAARADRGLVSA